MKNFGDGILISDNSVMKASGGGGRLILVCGLPGSGKTTLARELESRLHAVVFSPDEWMDALRLDVYDEERREKIEALQWKLGQELLALGLTIIIELGHLGKVGARYFAHGSACPWGWC